MICSMAGTMMRAATVAIETATQGDGRKCSIKFP
jgi:hypothetical protein